MNGILIVLIDEPRPQTNNRRTYSRGMPRFPFMSGGFPMMEGYTFITLDVGDRTNPVSDSLFYDPLLYTNPY